MRLALIALTACSLATPAFAAKHEKLTVHLKTSGGQDAGTATFQEESSSKLKITLNLKNLPAGQHAVHIHQNPICEAPDFKTAGGHFNPEKKMHGFDNPMGHHAGDMPKNVTVADDMTASTTFTVDYLSLGTGAPNDILANGGTSIMIHEKADDMKTDPTGAAGGRLACGVISETK